MSLVVFMVAPLPPSHLVIMMSVTMIILVSMIICSDVEALHQSL